MSSNQMKQGDESINLNVETRNWRIWTTERKINPPKKEMKEKWKESQGTCGNITKDLTFVPSETQKEKMKREGAGKVCKKHGKKISESGKRNRPTYPKTEWTTNRINPKKSNKTHYIQASENKDKKTSWKQWGKKENYMLSRGEKQFELHWV